MNIAKPLAPQEDDFTDYEVVVDVPEPDITEDEELEQPEPAIAGHFDNLAEFLSEETMAGIAGDLLDLFESAELSREDWLRTYTEGLEYLGFKADARTEPFENASGVFHPVLTEAVVRFQSNAIMEIFPAAGPAMVAFMGNETPEKVAQGKRIKEELNYQLTENMEEYRSEMEQLLFRLPLAGSVFKKVYYDQLLDRPCSKMVSADDFVVNAAETNIHTAEMVCQVIRISGNDVKKLMRAKFYRECVLGSATTYEPSVKEKEDSVSGTTQTEKNPRRVLLEFHVNLNIEEDSEDDIADPYIVTVDKTTSKVLSVYRNWDEGDPLKKKRNYFVHYQYMPGLGFYGIGLIHLMGSIAKAATSITRQLIDAGTFANLPGGLKTRGLRQSGSDDPIQPGEWRDVDVPAGAIGDNIFPLPYKEPSGVLSQLLLNLVEEGRRIGSIADADIGSSSGNMPVGTVLAIIERSLKVMSAVHARVHSALRKELKLIGKVINEYLPETYEWDDEGKFNRKEDFDGRVDILPVSDPNSATQTQKIVQMQAVTQLAMQAPELYNMKEVHRANLQAIGIKSDERLLPIDTDPPRLDPVQENMAILTQQPIKVYPDQDHKSHIEAHQAAMTDPKIMSMVANSPKAPMLQAQMEAHIAEHMALQYREDIQKIVGVELPPIGEPLPPEVENRISKLVAEAAGILRQNNEKEMAGKEAEQIAKDPVFQLREREVAIKERQQEHKEQMDKGQFVADIAKAVAREIIDNRRIDSTESIAGAEIGANLVTFGVKATAEERQSGVELGKQVMDNIKEASLSMMEMEGKERERQLDRMAEAAKARNRNDGA